MGSYFKKAEAAAAARKTRARMTCPRQWKIKTWFNDGWHYELLSPRGIAIHGSHIKRPGGEYSSFFCVISEHDALHTPISAEQLPPHRGGIDKSPQKAFEQARDHALKYIKIVNVRGKCLESLK